MKKRTLALLLALVMLFGITVGGTLAWLTDQTGPVTNTFTTSDIDITLEESENLDLQMIPGHTIKKDPVATVLKTSEDCFLFVKLEKSANYDTYLEDYKMADGWTKLDGVDGVYYREVAQSDEDQPFGVLLDNQMKVRDSVTKKQMNALTEDTLPTLTITAYASQLMKNNTEKFTAAEAWANVTDPTKTYNS